MRPGLDATLLALFISGCFRATSDRVLLPAHADPTHMGYGLSDAYLAAVAAHSGARGDTTWRITHRGLVLCTKQPAPTCVPVNTGAIRPDVLIVPMHERDEWARERRRRGLYDSVSERMNAVWVRGIATNLLDYKGAQLAFCWVPAEGGHPQCARAPLPAGRYVTRAIAAVAFDKPETTQSVWLTVRDPMSALFVSGFGAAGGDLVRCTASVSAPQPKCSGVINLDLHLEARNP